MNGPAVQASTIRQDLAEFLESKLKTQVAADADIFATGLVSSLFALELVLYLESNFGITVDGSDLKIDNFRTIEAMTALVIRLDEAGSQPGAGVTGAGAKGA